MSKKSFYFFITILLSVSYFWIFYNHQPHSSQNFGVCVFKETTDIPCPACGTTRSVLFLLKGEIIQSFLTNPLGILAVLGMIFVSIILVYDLFSKETKLYDFYIKFDKKMKNPYLFLPLILLFLLNWIWNILKGN